MRLNTTYEDGEGRITSPLYPLDYANDLDYWVRLAGPPGHRIIYTLTKMDIEDQVDCLYDSLEIHDEPIGSRPPTVLCGQYDRNALEK